MIDLDAYFLRIGYRGPRTPTLDTLRAIHELHPAAIPFEAIDVLLDRGINLTPRSIDAKLIAQKRGGYCYEQNSLLKRALEALGFEVEGLIARVRWMVPEDAPPRPRTHMVLRVHLDGINWLADVGFGGLVLTTPLRFDTSDAQTTQHEKFRLLPSAHGYRVEAQLEQKWEPLYDISNEPQLAVDYELANWYSSKYPASHFRHDLNVARTTSDARYTLLNNRLTIRPGNGEVDRRTLTATELAEALASIFQLPVNDEWQNVIENAVRRGTSNS
jgi:N-hydroxyarylamine O-acetyltransferase